MEAVEIPVSIILYRYIWYVSFDDAIPKNESDDSYCFIVPDFASAVAFCEYHHLTIKGYYKNQKQVTKEEIVQP